MKMRLLHFLLFRALWILAMLLANVVADKSVGFAGFELVDEPSVTGALIKAATDHGYKVKILFLHGESHRESYFKEKHRGFGFDYTKEVHFCSNGGTNYIVLIRDCSGVNNPVMLLYPNDELKTTPNMDKKTYLSLFLESAQNNPTTPHYMCTVAANNMSYHFPNDDTYKTYVKDEESKTLGEKIVDHTFNKEIQQASPKGQYFNLTHAYRGFNASACLAVVE